MTKEYFPASRNDTAIEPRRLCARWPADTASHWSRRNLQQKLFLGSGARLVLMGVSRTSSRHVVRSSALSWRLKVVESFCGQPLSV